MLALAGTGLAAAGDTATVRRLADSAEQIGKGSNWGRDPRLHHYLRGLLFQRSGQHLRGGVDGSNSYVTHTVLHEALALAFELAGPPDSAAGHYRAVERAWRRADPQFRERYLRTKHKAGV